MYKPLDRCRVSGSTNLIPVLHLGSQELTGVFPKPGEPVTEGPLDLVWCPDSGLLQLAHTYDPGEMYGDNYGYRSGLNASMVRHLSEKVAFLERLVSLRPGDSVLETAELKERAKYVSPAAEVESVPYCRHDMLLNYDKEQNDLVVAKILGWLAKTLA